MTEKRFIVKKSGSGLFYRDGDYEIDNTIQFIIETVEMKLNQLFDENEWLKISLKAFDEELSLANRDCYILEKENEELKHFREKVFSLIEDELKEHPYLTLTEKWNPNCKNYHSCRGNHEKNVFYASRHTLLKKLMEELSYD